MKMKIKDVLIIKYGKDYKKLKTGKTPLYGSGGIFKKVNESLFDGESILIPRKGTLTNVFYINGPFWTVDTIFWTKNKDEKKICMKYMYYFFLSKDLASLNNGSAVPSLTTEIINKIEIDLPSLDKQKEIANILSSLDDKIELNEEMNNTLEELGDTLYKQWFVDFEFPNEDGLPYKSNGGKFKESELGLIPDGWDIKFLKNYAPVATGKENANAAKLNGEYEFFTCSKKNTKIDTYKFNGNAILLAGNGDFSVKFYSGKFNAYQRTYVLIPEEPGSRDFLYYEIKNNLWKITGGHRGSVINFITKPMVENHKILNSKEKKHQEPFKDLNNIIFRNKKESESLIKMRKDLIEKLIK